MTSVALPWYTNAVTPLQKAKCIRHDLPLVKPCWQPPVTSLFSMCFSGVSRRIWAVMYVGMWCGISDNSSASWACDTLPCCPLLSPLLSKMLPMHPQIIWNPSNAQQMASWACIISWNGRFFFFFYMDIHLQGLQADWISEKPGKCQSLGGREEVKPWGWTSRGRRLSLLLVALGCVSPQKAD